MLQLTRKTDYALVALADLARRKLDEAGPTSARTIAEAYSMPLPLLMNILKELAQAKLVTSTRGASGGYQIAVEPSRVSMLEVINAIEGPVKLSPCCDQLPIADQGCGREDLCPIHQGINRVHRRIIDFFGQVMLNELIDEQVVTTPLSTSAKS
ncbi:RrF2 family transcriptional regulator [Algisphaera agarilytica]|uniref:Rrf2 family protein n=1 Tax=Algisphaera agarilytica TaxID=1385975 RepID=A0A7X0H842_9BACT|nr:Rrf2 family transcriptional regulator [Algisphaera agarilytica]MBB6429861.1 Rrf2 family protein [Algisphaera agarilytica]